MTTRYSIIGLGKLGASMAAAIASKGFDVIGVDIDQRTVDLVNEGKAPVQETDLNETIAANRDRIRATTDSQAAVQESDVSFVIVPTPSDEEGVFSLQYAKYAFKELGKGLAEKDDYHTIVLTSTVLPGSTRYGLLPILEEASGKRAGEDFGLCYSPEFIALGSVIRDFLNPDFTLVGELDERSGDQLEACYSEILSKEAPCKRMSLENAELAKIAVNTYVTTKMTFANMLSGLCERIPGGDVDVVTDALGEDNRIGHSYLKGALGYGGPCFPRDNIALSAFAEAIGASADLATATDHLNRSIPDEIIARIEPKLSDGATVAVLGLSYKPDSHVVEESQGVQVAHRLSKTGVRVVGYDPLALETAREELHDHVVLLPSVEACLEQADIVLIANPDPLFKKLSATDFTRDGETVTVVDAWRLLDEELDGAPGIDYVPIGRSVDDDTNEARLVQLWNGGAEGER